MQFEFKRHRMDKVSRDAALDALERVAAFFGYVEFGKRDVAKASVGISASAIRNAFHGSWSSAIGALREKLRQKGKDLKSRSRAVWSHDQMFEEMRRVWTELRHRPSKDEWNASNPKISYNTYRQRFRGWENACLRFIEHQMSGYAPQLSAAVAPTKGNEQPLLLQRVKSADRREPSQALINKVWKRDGFRCRRCGRSPATHFRVIIEVDHIVPWAEGGKTTLENLQTLCTGCNRSKRDEMPDPSLGV